MKNKTFLKIIQPDDWHVHLREGDMMKVVTKFSSRINNRCVVMPNLATPITNSYLARQYKEKLSLITAGLNFTTLLPCYLIDTLDLDDFKLALKEDIFVGAKLYPINVTTNSSFGISKIDNIFSALEILEELGKPLLVHGEKVREDINIFDREKYFIDEELQIIRNRYPSLKIILEHVSSEYGTDFVKENKNTAGTITPHHMMLTKKDFFYENSINPHHFCMPVVKEESDLIALRKCACSGNKKFFLGTDSAPHHVNLKLNNMSSKPGIFSSPCSLEIYVTIFEEEKSLDNLESFSSYNGPTFYGLPINTKHITLKKETWIVPEYTIENNVKIRNFLGGKELNWKVV